MTSQSEGKGEAQRHRSGLDLITLVLRRRRLLVGLPLLAMVSALAFSFLLPRRYTVESRFTPESASGGAMAGLGALAGLAGELGFQMPGAGAEPSLDFYAELLESPELLRRVALTEYRFPASEGGDTLEGNLVELFDIDEDTEAERVQTAVEELDELILSRPDHAANMIALEVSAPWPALAVRINERILELLSEFNLERRQSRAAAERSFLDSRLAAAQQELRQAESAIERFHTENRRYRESPQLIVEAQRLQRRVDHHQQVYTTLAQAYEQARVEEVRNTPVITVVDPPRPPAERTAPNFVLNAALGLLLGLLVAFGAVVVRELMTAAESSDPDGYARLRAATRETVRDVRADRLFGWLRRNGAAAEHAPATHRPGPVSDPSAAPRSVAGRSADDE